MQEKKYLELDCPYFGISNNKMKDLRTYILKIHLKMGYSFSLNFYFHLFDTGLVALVLHFRKIKKQSALLCHLSTL